mmetsp:Transcript_8251/g.26131  ORF Transcript_8251/g.26131 Transcript_8251/m.26131 type:complete len:311 (-) Transcript_8251:666-1598(-)
MAASARRVPDCGGGGARGGQARGRVLPGRGHKWRYGLCRPEARRGPHPHLAHPGGAGDRDGFHRPRLQQRQQSPLAARRRAADQAVAAAAAAPIRPHLRERCDHLLCQERPWRSRRVRGHPPRLPRAARRRRRGPQRCRCASQRAAGRRVAAGLEAGRRDLLRLCQEPGLPAGDVRGRRRAGLGAHRHRAQRVLSPGVQDAQGLERRPLLQPDAAQPPPPEGWHSPRPPLPHRVPCRRRRAARRRRLLLLLAPPTRHRAHRRCHEHRAGGDAASLRWQHRRPGGQDQGQRHRERRLREGRGSRQPGCGAR